MCQLSMAGSLLSRFNSANPVTHSLTSETLPTLFPGAGLPIVGALFKCLKLKLKLKFKHLKFKLKHLKFKHLNLKFKCRTSPSSGPGWI